MAEPNEEIVVTSLKKVGKSERREAKTDKYIFSYKLSDIPTY